MSSLRYDQDATFTVSQGTHLLQSLGQEQQQSAPPPLNFPDLLLSPLLLLIQVEEQPLPTVPLPKALPSCRDPNFLHREATAAPSNKEH